MERLGGGGGVDGEVGGDGGVDGELGGGQQKTREFWFPGNAGSPS